MEMVQARVGSDGTVGMMVRMSEGLRDRIKAAAEANGRSQNSEIVATLEEKYPARNGAEGLSEVLSMFEQQMLRASKLPDGPDKTKIFHQINGALVSFSEDVVEVFKDTETAPKLRSALENLLRASKKLQYLQSDKDSLCE